MKKLVFVVIFALGLISVSLKNSAQQKSFSPFSTQTMDAINATPEQRTALKKLVDKYKPKFKVKDNEDTKSKEEYTTQ